MSNLLVTGGAGFIGVNFVHYWLETHPADTVVVLDALTYAGNRASLAPVAANPNFTFVHGNICDTDLVEKLLTEHEVDTLVHFAAESHVDRSITGPDAFIETNIIGTHSLLKACKKIWIDEPKASGKESKGGQPLKHRFHHVSTDEVYGDLSPTDPAFNEDTQYSPNSPYSASKAASDHLVRAYHHTYGLEVTTSNCSNNYGPYHFPEKLIPLVITNILQNKPLPIYGDGQQIRDWLYVTDHARGIELVLQKGRLGECYNIGGINEWANIDIVKLICKLMDEAFASSVASSEKMRNREKDNSRAPQVASSSGTSSLRENENREKDLESFTLEGENRRSRSEAPSHSRNLNISLSHSDPSHSQKVTPSTLASRYPTALAAITGDSESLITYVTDRAGHDRRYAINPTKSNDELGYQPVESFETGIRKTVEWYLGNQDWLSSMVKVES